MMSILNKQLNREELATLDLFLQGALAPLEGYLTREDHVSVIKGCRLANGYLWPMPFSLQLSPAEKLQVQLSGRIALLDNEQRIIAEVNASTLYRLPPDIAKQAGKSADSWYAGGNIQPQAKVLHSTFNRIRHNTDSLHTKLQDNNWQQVIALHTSAKMNSQDMQQACHWLKQHSNNNGDGGILLQVSADDAPDLPQNMRQLRANIRCNAAKQVNLSVLPVLPELSPERQLILQARIAKNYGATGFIPGSAVPRSHQQLLLKHRDELGLELLLSKRSQFAQPQCTANAQAELSIAA
ncbi:MAG: hypothetical protein ACPGVP_07410 [Thiolinea sp.]